MRSVCGLLFIFLIVGAAQAAEPASVAVQAWPVPWEQTRPRDPDVDAQGRVWFVGQTGDYVAYLDPDTGDFTRYPLPDGTGPHNQIVGPDGAIWYAGNRAAHIGRLDPGTGAIVKYPMPDAAARDPHTLIDDGNGHIWFTVQGGNFVGRLTLADGEVKLLAVPTEDARPYGIALTAQGQPWIAELGTHKLGTVEPPDMHYREIDLPREDARPRRIGASSDGRVWYVDYAEGYLGVYDPAAGTFAEWPGPFGAETRPYGMAVDAQDRIWFVATGPQPNVLIGFDPASKTYFSQTELKDAYGAVRHMVYHNGVLWFGTDSNYIMRAVLPKH